MRTLTLSLFLLGLLSVQLTGQSKPVPPARRELQKYHSTHPEEPAQPLRSHRNPAQLQHEAEELAKLAQSIALDVDRINQGMLPKDVLEKLKRIEKISKHLRWELAP